MGVDRPRRVRESAGVYQTVGVDDGLVVVGLMSQSDGLVEETRGSLQLTPIQTQLTERDRLLL